MARIRLIHWDWHEGRERRQHLAALGHEPEFDDLDGPALGRVLRSRPPDLVLIDLSRRPSHGREVATGLRTAKSLRHIPIVFVDGDPEKVSAIRTILPDATYTTWGRLRTTIPKALARPVVTPVVPPTSIYSGKPAVEKLGVKPDMRVALINAPTGAAELLAPLPAGATLSAKAAPTTDLFLVFVRTQRELAAQLATLARNVSRQTVWFIWPKTAAKTKTDLNGNIVRESGLAAGLVDFKICSVDDTWSGLAFKRRR